jgi:hypothetical protein
MLALRSWLRCGAAAVLTVALLGLGAACHKGSNADTIRVTGQVSYARVPVLYDANGSPTGLGASVPGWLLPQVVVRAFQLYDVVGQDGTAVPTWRLVATALTDSNGRYTFTGEIKKGQPTFLELASIFEQVGGNASTVRVIADPAGINSSLAETQRPIYLYRIDLNGNTFTDPTSDPHSLPAAESDVTRDFALGDNDTWAVSLDTWYQPGNVGSAAKPPSDTLPLGSKVLGILGTIYNFSYYYGDPTPSQAKGGVMDLHYWPGGSASGAAARTESPRRSFVVYDRSTTPKSYDGTLSHYFATLAGGPTADDAWDPGAIYPLLGRNNLWGQGKTTLYPAGSTSLPSEAPDLAVVDGLADDMAAGLLKSPFLTDTTASTGLVPRDIRTIPAVTGPGSPAALAAMGWKVVLMANGINDGVGSKTAWAGLDPAASLRFFILAYPSLYASPTSSKLVRADITSILGQMIRLQEAKTGSDPVDLRTIFYDLALYLLGQPYGITWTTVPTIPVYSDSWGANPPSQAFPAFTLSMANAVTVANPDLRVTDPTLALVYPNVSQGAVHDATLSLNLDTAYTLSVATDQALPTGASIEVTIDGDTQTPYLFTSSAPSVTYPVVMVGNPKDFVNPQWHYLRIRLIAPEPATVVPDLKVTVRLDKTS